MTPTDVQTASCRGMVSLSRGVVSTTRAPAAAKMPISAHNIQAGKNAPNKSNEGAPTNEQPMSVQLETTRRAALGSEGAVIVLWARPYGRSLQGRAQFSTQSWTDLVPFGHDKTAVLALPLSHAAVALREARLWEATPSDHKVALVASVADQFRKV